MLVLTRYPGQEIAIGEDIVIKVGLVNNHSVKIGIEAPKDVTILRNEIVGKYKDGPKK